MSDPTQNPPPPEGSPGSSRPSEPPSTEPPRTESSSAQPPQGQPQGQGSYGPGYAPPPPPAGGSQQQGGWQQPGQMPPAPSPMGRPGQPADLLPRFLARLIDYILLAVVEGVLSAVVFGIIWGTANGGPLTGFGLDTGTTYALAATSRIITALISLAYFAVMEAKLGQTVGKMVVKLETRGPGGGHPTFEQAVRRNAWVAIGILGVIPFLGWVASLLSLVAVITIAVTISNNTTNRHGWHDDFAGGTTVYKIG